MDRCLRLATEREVDNIEGRTVAVQAGPGHRLGGLGGAEFTYGHGDTPQAVDMARRVRHALTEAGSG